MFIFRPKIAPAVYPPHGGKIFTTTHLVDSLLPSAHRRAHARMHRAQIIVFSFVIFISSFHKGREGEGDAGIRAARWRQLMPWTPMWLPSVSTKMPMKPCSPMEVRGWVTMPSAARTRARKWSTPSSELR